MRISDWSSDVCSSDLLDGTWPEPLSPGPKSALGIGLFRHRTNDGNPLLPSPLPVAALRARIERCWRPYHHALLEALDALHARPRSEERRVGKECVSTGKFRWSPSH